MPGRARHTEREERKVAVLHRVALALASSLTFDEVLRVLAHELVEAIERADECSISLWDRERDRLLEVAAHTRYGPPTWPVGEHEDPLDRHPETRALLEAARGYGQYRLSDPALKPADRGALEQWGWRASVELPLVLENRSVGLIEVADYRSSRPFSAPDVGFCQTIATLAAVAVRNAKLFEELQDRAERDSLTSLLVHAAFYERLGHELARTREQGKPLALLVLDLDDFKNLNDSRGHLVGDELLRETAAALRSECREGDVLGRLGGDEFGVILPGVGIEAELVGHRLLKAIAARGIHASVGVALAAHGDLDPVVVVERADQSLREAKRAGKRTLRIAESS